MSLRLDDPHEEAIWDNSYSACVEALEIKLGRHLTDGENICVAYGMAAGSAYYQILQENDLAPKNG